MRSVLTTARYRWMTCGVSGAVAGIFPLAAMLQGLSSPGPLIIVPASRNRCERTASRGGIPETDARGRRFGRSLPGFYFRRTGKSRDAWLA